MSLAISSQGTLIEVEALPKGSAVWKEIEEVASIGASGASSAEIDVTHLRSLAKEYLLGLPDNGTIPLAGNYLGAGTSGQDEMYAAFNDRAERNFRITFPDSTIYTFPGRCSVFDIGAQPDSKLDLSMAVRITGARAFA